MKSIAGILCWGVVGPDGKSFISDLFDEVLPLAKGFNPRQPGAHERYWIVQQRCWLFWIREVAFPFEEVGYSPVGQ